MTQPNEELLKIVSHVASSAALRYSTWIDRDDIYQELYLYTLTEKTLINKWLSEGETLRVFRALFGAAKQYAEGEKAQKSGYEFSDIAWYTPDKLADLVPLATNKTWDGLSGELNEEGMPGSKSLGSEGGNLLAMVVDVRRVLDNKPARYGGWDIDTDLGLANLEWLAEQLGGEYPDAPGYHRARRKAVRNETAINQTTNGY